jgi:hypothetical protein
MTSHIVGPYRHKDICGCEPRRARSLDAAGVAKVAAREAAKALKPVVGAIDRITTKITELEAKHRDVDAKVNRVQSHRDAVRAAEERLPPPRGYIRDGAMIRAIGTSDLQANADAYYEDRGKRKPGPGEPGYTFAPSDERVTSVHQMQAIADRFWGRGN